MKLHRYSVLIILAISLGSNVFFLAREHASRSDQKGASPKPDEHVLSEIIYSGHLLLKLREGNVNYVEKHLRLRYDLFRNVYGPSSSKTLEKMDREVIVSDEGRVIQVVPSAN